MEVHPGQPIASAELQLPMAEPVAALWGGDGAASGISLIRALDVVLSALLLLLMLPLFLLIAAAIRLSGKGPVFFAHGRLGRDGATFPCLKFRTMAPNAEQLLAELLASDPEIRLEWELNRKLKRDPRITAVGGLLRRTSLDEIPQLLNVLRGDMSLVGPRPIVRGEVPLYGRYYRDYLRVRPGITGLWQISGRNDTSYRRRVALDVCYTRRRSLGLYLYVLWRTPACVWSSRGCY